MSGWIEQDHTISLWRPEGISVIKFPDKFKLSSCSNPQISIYIIIYILYVSDFAVDDVVVVIRY